MPGKDRWRGNGTTLPSFDLVLISTNHACVNYEELAAWAPCIVDTRNAMAGDPGSNPARCGRRSFCRLQSSALRPPFS